jgi:hypothetical protein
MKSEDSSQHLKNEQLGPVLNQFHMFHIFTYYLSNINFNIIFPYTLRSYEGICSSGISTEVSHYPHSSYLSSPTNPPLFNRPTNIKRSVQIIKILIM